MSKERLVELIGNAPIGVNGITLLDKHEPKAIEEIADHLLANGVVVPPCKVGARVYSIACGKIYEWDIASYTVDLEGKSFLNVAFMGANCLYRNTYRIEDIGETVFLTREEAEAKLRSEDNA